MTAPAKAPSPRKQRADAERVLSKLTTLADYGMTDVAAAVAQLDASLHPLPVRAPLAGRHAVVCEGCRRAVDRADLRWWPRPLGAAATLRLYVRPYEARRAARAAAGAAGKEGRDRVVATLQQSMIELYGRMVRAGKPGDS